MFISSFADMSTASAPVLRQRATLRIFRVRTISCSDEPVEGGWREAATVVAAVGWVMPPSFPSKESHFASS